MRRFYVILLFMLISCSTKEYSTNYSYKYLDNEINITAISPSKEILEIDLNKLFDSDKTTFWSLNNTKNLRINIMFKKPIYLYSLIGYLSKNIKNNNLSYVHIEGQTDENNMPNIYEKLHFSGNRFEFKQDKVLFKTKTISLSFFIRDNDSISMTEIDLLTKNIPYYNTKYSLDEINDIFVKNKKEWKFDDPNEAISQDVLMSLVYYALNGNKQAEKLLYSFKPSGASDGEIYLALINDYENTKKH